MALMIEPLDGFEWQCGIGAIVAAAKYYHCEYQLSFRDLWKFNFSKPDDGSALLGSQIGIDQSEVIELLHSFCNFKVTDLCINELSQVLSIIKRELSLDKPAKLRMDLFYCPWHKEAYRTYHLAHSFLITGFDEKNNSLVFIDHSPIVSNGIFNIGELPPVSDYTVSTFEMDDKKAEVFCWQASVMECCNRVLGMNGTKNIFELQREFADQLICKFDLETELAGQKKFLQTDMYKNMIGISQNRFLFGRHLNFIYEKFNIPELLEVKNNMDIVAEKWGKVKNIFVRFDIEEDHASIIGRISKRIREVSLLEEKIAYDLLEIVENYAH